MSKNKTENENETAIAIKYPTAVLLKSKALAKYQPDFVRVILSKPEYTLDEAIAAIEKELKKEV